MGFPKALLEISHEPMALFMAQEFLHAGINRICLAIPTMFYGRAWLVAKLEKLGVKIICNRFPNLGYAGTIISAMGEVNNCDGLFITPIDALISRKLILHLKNLASFSQKPSIIVPYYYFKAGHPVFLSAHFFSALRTCNNFGGLHRVIERYKNDVICYDSFDKRILYNLNDTTNSKLAPKIANIKYNSCF